MEIEMKIKGLVVDPISKMPIVVLEDLNNERILPIWIGVFEANAIALKIENISTPRPMTHDLVKNFLDKLNINVYLSFVMQYYSLLPLSKRLMYRYSKNLLFGEGVRG